ncbi:MAG TPA: substrate-binding domain-containing protein [Planctomycetaceae bacterium]|nr:substrate-binding domain-containing protein [Planctomycetaceae bacterium]
MSKPPELQNHVKALRLGRGWSQAELARRAGISRAAVSAIEVERLVPSVAAALSLAEAFGCRVDAVFALHAAARHAPQWAWPAAAEPCRFWHAEIGGRTLLYPAETSGLGVVGHDGIYSCGMIEPRSQNLPENTLVLASCDPAAALLAAELARETPFRLLVVPRSSGEALRLLGRQLVHVAGVHLAKAGPKRGNAGVVRRQLGAGFSLLRVARWQEGLAVAPGLGVQSVRGALRKRLRWVGREAGSGARACLDELLEDREKPRREARDHRGVAEAIRCGWADVGVCVRLVSDEAGLEFLSVRDETYDLCFASEAVDDARIKALINVVRSEPYRRLLGELPGYDTREAGELETVT